LKRISTDIRFNKVIHIHPFPPERGQGVCDVTDKGAGCDCRKILRLYGHPVISYETAAARSSAVQVPLVGDSEGCVSCLVQTCPESRYVVSFK
ncbi:MAG: hypothetical protein LBD27_00310, partial [Tannerella sp.]|nr:hypothetical protein [Tannerella sp.]